VVAGCSAILGLDSGKPRPDDDAAADSALAEASPPEEAAHPDAGYDATLTDAGADAPEASPLDAAQDGDAPSDGPILSTLLDVIDACTPDPSWCDLHCGTGPDNCGESRICNPECALGYVCGTGNLCACQTELGWCTARCGDTLDNCGNAIDCGPCDAGGEAACDPEDMDAACGSQQCGQATNICGQLVNCGPGQLTVCGSSTQFCLPDGGCCTPDNAAACGTHCGAYTATNGCGQTTSCPGSCGGTLICFNESCCTPVNPCGNACGETLTDNCGQSVACACASGQECMGMTCCTPSGCGGNCLDSCGAESQACCVPEAGPPDSSLSDGPGAVDAMPETGSPESGASDSGAGVADATPDGTTTGAGPDAGTGPADSASGTQGNDATSNDGTTSDGPPSEAAESDGGESDSGADDAGQPDED
jgi:hypothetical protein